MSPDEQQPPAKLSDELRPYVGEDEAEALDRVADLLAAEDPHPSAAFRATLHARLRADLDSATVTRPQRLRLLVAAYLSSGFGLLALAALGAAGGGPLGVP